MPSNKTTEQVGEKAVEAVMPYRLDQIGDRALTPAEAKEFYPAEYAALYDQIEAELLRAQPHLLSSLLSPDAVEAGARGVAEAGDSVFAWEQMPEDIGNRLRKQRERLSAETRDHCRALAEAAIQAAINAISGGEERG